MALTVEDGTGIAGAESYASVAEFDAYWDIEVRDPSEAVTAADVCKKEIALRISTQNLELNCGSSFIGMKRTKAQGLHFPANGGVRRDGFPLDTDEIPQEVKDASFELAARYLDGVNLFDPDQVGGVGSVLSTKKKIGPIEKETEYTTAGQDEVTFFPIVNQILSPIVNVTAGFSEAIRN